MLISFRLGCFCQTVVRFNGLLGAYGAPSCMHAKINWVQTNKHVANIVPVTTKNCRNATRKKASALASPDSIAITSRFMIIFRSPDRRIRTAPGRLDHQ